MISIVILMFATSCDEDFTRYYTNREHAEEVAEPIIEIADGEGKDVNYFDEYELKIH